MRTLILRAKGEYAHFGKPYAPMSPVTYPFPPPPSVLGLLGAVLGLDKGNYHQQLGWEHVKIGVRLLSPVRVFRTAMNLLNTKDGTDRYFRPKKGKNVHIQVPFEFLKDPDYFIYVAGLAENTHEELKEFLWSGRSYYTPVLGLAQCIAELDWVGEAQAQPLELDSWRVDSVLATDRAKRSDYEEGRRYHRFRVPALMDGERVVHRYQEVVVADDAGPISGRGNSQGLYRVGDDIVSFL